MLLNIEEEQTLDRTTAEQLSRIVEFLLKSRRLTTYYSQIQIEFI